MRTLTASEALVLATSDRATYLKVEVQTDTSPSTWVDLTDLAGRDWVIAAEWGESVDGRMADAVLTLKTRQDDVSLSPWCTASAANSPNVALALNHDVRISTATVAWGTTPATADWHYVFEGYIDQFDVGIANTTVNCLDYAGRLASAYMTSKYPIGSTAGIDVETVMQSILTAWAVGAPTLWSLNGKSTVPYNTAGFPTDSPAWAIGPQDLDREPVLNALWRMADAIGWTVRYRYQYDTDTSTWVQVLMFYSPDRADTTSVRTFEPEEYLSISGARLALADIRNTVQVVYRDTEGTWQYPTPSTDAASVTKYGSLWMEVAEEATSQIDTVTEADALADAALSDLSEPSIELAIDVPFFYAVQLHDVYKFSANGVVFDADQTLAVAGYRHRIDAKASRTTLTVRGKPCTAVKRWGEKHAVYTVREIGWGNIMKDGEVTGNLCPNGDFANWTGK